MKVSVSKFYQEVTGSRTGNATITKPALKRWGVPFEDHGKRGDAVDVAYLDVARKAYAGEQQDAPAANPAARMMNAVTANTRALVNLEAAIMLLVEHVGALETRKGK